MKKMKIKNISFKPYKDGNLREIEKHKHNNEGFEHSCAECMYYQACDDGIKEHEKWLDDMREKHGDCGYLIYSDGELAGFIQVAPQKELLKLKEFNENADKSDAWYLTCIYVYKEIDANLKMQIVKRSLKFIFNELKSRGVKIIGMSAPIIEGTISSMPFSWDFYEKEGFIIKSKGDEYAEGYIKL